ncbi:hypothetical protein BH10PLA2_BH10PLA2_00880 [soil metagenome]
MGLGLTTGETEFPGCSGSPSVVAVCRGWRKGGSGKEAAIIAADAPDKLRRQMAPQCEGTLEAGAGEGEFRGEFAVAHWAIEFYRGFP